MSEASRHFARTLDVRTYGRSTLEITSEIQSVVSESEVAAGVCNVFVHHTSASLIISENADPSVRGDLERFISKLVRDGDPMFEHTAEGPDDMSAHVRSILTATSITLPVNERRCALGTWQGVFLWEHRESAHNRRVTVSVLGS